MDVVAEFIVEFFLDIYMELVSHLLKRERLTRGQRVLATVLAVLVALSVLFLAFWGLYLLVEAGDLFGLVPLLIAVAVSGVQITAALVLRKKNK